MKKLGFGLIAGLFLIMCAFVFAQEEPAMEGALDFTAPGMGGGAPGLGLIKGKVTDTQTPRANNLDGAEITVESELLLAGEGGKRTTHQIQQETMKLAIYLRVNML
jgi:hypothetical protein